MPAGKARQHTEGWSADKAVNNRMVPWYPSGTQVHDVPYIAWQQGLSLLGCCTLQLVRIQALLES